MSTPRLNINITSGTFVRLAVFIILGLMLVRIRDLILVILTSITIASFVEAGVHKLGKWKIGRTLAVFLIYIITILFLFILFYLFIPIIIDEVAGLLTLVKDQFIDSNLFVTLPGDSISEAQNFVSGLTNATSLSEGISGSAQSLISGLSGGFIGTLSLFFGGILNFVLITVISFYLSVQDHGVENFLRIVIPLKHEDYAIDLWRRTERKIGLWFQGQLVLAFFIFILTYIGLLIIGVPYALLISLVTGLFELVPYGILLAIIPAVAFAYLDGGITLALIVVAFYTILQQIENYIIQPLVMRRMIGISPLVVILAILIGAKLAGFWGFILAIPMAVLVLEFMGDLERNKIAAKSTT